MQDFERRAAVESYLSTVSPQVYRAGLFHANPEDGLVRLAGVIPYRETPKGIEICMLRPKGNKPELGAPLFEICKGTRMWQLPDGNWMDLKKPPYPTEGTPETLLVTALREGMEEIGLPLDGIQNITQLGHVAFSSQTNKSSKVMDIYLLKVDAKTPFAAPDALAADTGEVRWWTPQHALQSDEVREDHRAILRRVLAEKKLFTGASLQQQL